MFFVSENVERVLENMLLIIRVGGKVGYVNSEYHHASTHMKPLLLLDTHYKMFSINLSGCIFGLDGQADLGPFVTLILAKDCIALRSKFALRDSRKMLLLITQVLSHRF